MRTVKYLSLIVLLLSTLSTNATTAPKAAPWTLQTLAGKSLSLSDLKGKPVLMVFWATWCPYCKKLLPGIERLHQKYGPQGLQVIGVTIREDGDPAAYMKRYGYTFTVALDGDGLMKAYHVSGTPTIAVIDKEGFWHAHLRTSDPNSTELEDAVRTSLGLAKLPKKAAPAQ